MSDVTNANIPGGAPLVDSNGQITQVWYQFLLAMFNRTGGGGTPVDITTLQKYATAIEVTANTAVPVPSQRAAMTEGLVPVSRPQQIDYSQQMVYAVPAQYAIQNQAANFTAVRASLAAKVFAQNTSAQSIANSTTTTVTGWTTVFDKNANFVASTGVFTAPRAGQYLVSVNLTYNTAAWGTATVGQIFILKNGTSLYAQASNIGTTTSVALRITTGALLVDCAAGDTITIQTNQNSGVAIALSAGATLNTLSITELP